MSSNILNLESGAYEILDSGDGLRLESWAGKTIVRPDPNVLWAKTRPQDPGWENPDAGYVGKTAESGWKFNTEVQNGWKMTFGEMKVLVRPTPFRHLGLFPEQYENWEWLNRKIAGSANPKPKVLNLFGYTGAASIVAALSGASVCHVDASKGSIYWAKENAQISGLNAEAIRWIVDDALKFMHREVRRGNTYDLIMMDPPVFGRGPKGEVWRLEEGILELVQLARTLLSPEPLGFLLNFYATAIYPESIARIVKGTMGEVFPKLQLGTLSLKEKYSQKQLQTGYILRSE